MSDGRDAWDKTCGKGCRAPMLSGIFILPQTPHVHQLRSSPNIVCFLWKLHYIGMVGHGWLNSISRPLNSISRHFLLGLGGWTKISNSLITWLVPRANSLQPQVTQGLSKSHLINITKDTFIVHIIQEIPRALGALCQEQEEDQCIGRQIDRQISQYHKNQNQCQLKKMHNLKAENYDLFSRLTEDFKFKIQPLRQL